MPIYTFEAATPLGPVFEDLLAAKGIVEVPSRKCRGAATELRRCRALERKTLRTLCDVAGDCEEASWRYAFGDYITELVELICEPESGVNEIMDAAWFRTRAENVDECLCDAVRGYEENDCPEDDAWPLVRKLRKALFDRAAALLALSIAEVSELKTSDGAE